MKTVWARIGQPITLPCEMESGNGPVASSAADQLEWRKNGSLIFNAFGTEPGFLASEYQGRLSRASAMGLTIHSVQLQDQSTFLCSISRFPRGKTVGGREYGKMIRLIVHSMPRILEPLDGSKIFIRENNSLRMNCLAEGIPSPSIKWSKKMKNGSWDNVSFTSQLTIERFADDEEGDYNCEAQNFEGTKSAVVTLKMRKPLRIDRHNPSLVNKTTVEGTAVFWQCAAETQKEWAGGKVRIRWTKRGRAISELEVGLRAHFNDQDGSFGIMNLRRTDSGEFECRATLLDSADDDGLLENDNVKVQLDVQYKPEVSPKTRRFYTLVTGQAAQLDCLIEANPSPTVVRWTKNGREITAHMEKNIEPNLLLSTVRIFFADLEDSAGTYTCEAQNAIGATEPHVEIHVVVTEAPKFTKIPAPKYIVKAGEKVEIECEGFAQVPIRRVWSRKEEGKHSSFTDRKFVLANVTRTDHGLYCCLLISSIATVSRDVQLIVHGTAPQCATNVRVHCDGLQRLVVQWVPGYAGGNHLQSFRIFYRQIYGGSTAEKADKWKETTDQQADHSNRLLLDNLALFGEYELKLEVKNRIGAVNCTVPGTHYTCAKLDRPGNFLFDNSEFDGQKILSLKWDKVEEANAYKIKHRKSCAANRESDGNFQEMAQTSVPLYKMSSDMFNANSNSKCCHEFIVRASRAPFTDSDHSSLITYPIGCSDGTHSSSLYLISFCAIFPLFLLFIFAFFCSLQRIASKAHLFPPKNWSTNDTKSAALQKQRLINYRAKSGNKQRSKLGQIGKERSGEGPPFGDSFDHISSSRCVSTSSSSASVYAHCAFGHPIAITRKLFPENYICTKFARFDEEEAANKSEGFDHLPSENATVPSAFNGERTNSENNFNWSSANKLAENWPDHATSATSTELHLVDGKSEGSAVVEMLREKYLFADAELNVLHELRIERLRREMSRN